MAKESEWRYSIYEVGMSDAGWKLCARVSNIIGNRVYIVKESATTWGAWLQVPPFTALPVRVQGPFTIGPGQRFPYGQPVVPD